MTPRDFVAALGDVKDVSAQWKVLEKWLRAGQRQNLIEVAHGCDVTLPHEWQKRSIHDKIVQLLALERDARNLEAIGELARFSPRKVGYLAEIATQNQDWRDFLPLFDSLQSHRENREFLAFAAQELVLCGHDLRETAAHRFYEADVVPDGHELGVLPLFRLECEANFPAWRRVYNRQGGASWSINGKGQKSAVSVAGKTPTFSENEGQSEMLGCAVANWCEASNGKIESRCFKFAPLQIEDFGLQTLKSFALESLEGAQEGTLTRVDFASALENLFQAACNGGAYNSGEYGALGRLKTWQSVAALCGSDSQHAETISQKAQNCTWFELSADGSWFYNVAWDLGLACLRQTGDSLAVLCATDTD